MIYGKNRYTKRSPEFIFFFKVELKNSELRSQKVANFEKAEHISKIDCKNRYPMRNIAISCEKNLKLKKLTLKNHSRFL